MNQTFQGGFKLLVLLIFCFAAPSFAQEEPLSVTSPLTDGEWRDRRSEIEITLSRPLTPAEGRIAVFIGATDFTDLFSTIGTTVRYKPQTVPLPSGESEVIVHLVASEEEWREIGRFPLRVRTRGGFETVTFAPRLDLNNKGQVAEDHSPESNAPPRDTYQDLTGQGSVTLEAVRGGWTIGAEGTVIGVTHKNEALRFGDEGEEAPSVDLSSHLFRLQHQNGSGLSFGHISYGNNRHLMSGFGSRGLSGLVKVGKHADVSLSAMNGTSIVGWDNFTGLQLADHRIYAGTFGVDFLASRPGGVRLEATVLDGSLLPLTPFNQGLINDAETSRGAGFRLLLSDSAQRFRLDGGYSRSRFNNPEDPFLDQGASTVPVREETRDAQYVDVSYSLLQNRAFGNNRFANLSVAYRHERVDPLYRSVAAFTSADRLFHTFEAQSTISDVAMQFSYSRSEDNLDDIPSILKTFTRISTVGISVPTASLRSNRDNPAPALPILNFSFNRTHQFGGDIPENSEFNATHIPDQVSDSYQAGAQWQGNSWNFGYSFSFSAQDNRQLSRENADLDNMTHGFAISVRPKETINLGFDVNLERAENLEVNTVDLTRRFGINVSWNPHQRLTLGAILNTTKSYDENDINESINHGINLEAAYRFLTINHSQGQLFLRFANTISETTNRQFGINQELRGWTINTGLSLSIF